MASTDIVEGHPLTELANPVWQDWGTYGEKWTCGDLCDDPRCLHMRGCKGELIPIERCAKNDDGLRQLKALSVDEVVAEGEKYSGKIVRIYGQMIHHGFYRGVVCGTREACPAWSSQLGLAQVGMENREAELILGGNDFVCAGDTSALCCRISGVGHTVIATGILERGRPWTLRSPSVCMVY